MAEAMASLGSDSADSKVLRYHPKLFELFAKVKKHPEKFLFSSDSSIGTADWLRLNYLENAEIWKPEVNNGILNNVEIIPCAAEMSAGIFLKLA